jgi:hypothetical protein
MAATFRGPYLNYPERCFMTGAVRALCHLVKTMGKQPCLASGNSTQNGAIMDK